MNVKNILLSSLIGFVLIIFSQNFAQAQTNLEEFMIKWENAKQFSLEVVDKMPDELLTYKPHETAMTFSEQITHFCGTITGISKRYLIGKESDFNFTSNPITKEGLKAFVTASYDYGRSSIEALTEDDLNEKIEIFGNIASRRQVISLMDDHATHHRGAAISYIRAHGIEPPRYRGL